MGVGGRVGRVVVGAEIGFRFHDAAGDKARVGVVDEEFAQEAGSNNVRTRFKERPVKRAAGQSIGCPP